MAEFKGGMLMRTPFPVIDPVATGQNITRLRNACGLTVRDLQAYFGFEDPQAIYKWQRGQSLPSVDNLFALSALLQVPMDEILVSVGSHSNTSSAERQDESCRSVRFLPVRTVAKQCNRAVVLILESSVSVRQ